MTQVLEPLLWQPVIRGTREQGIESPSITNLKPLLQIFIPWVCNYLDSLRFFTYPETDPSGQASVLWSKIKVLVVPVCVKGCRRDCMFFCRSTHSHRSIRLIKQSELKPVSSTSNPFTKVCYQQEIIESNRYYTQYDRVKT